jgi:hypothetical protein
MLRRTLGVVLVNVIVFAVLAELLALFLFYNETGRLFYTYRKRYEPIAETQQGRLTGDGLHPYFGPTHRQGYPFDIPEPLRENVSSPSRVPTNNFGFASTHDYPFIKTSPNQFVIGLFGGSVGAWFCQVGTHRLVEDLQANAFFKSRGLQAAATAAPALLLSVDRADVRSGREHRRLQRGDAFELQQRARDGHLDAERDASRSAGESGEPGDADAGEAAIACRDQRVQGPDKLSG